MHLINFVFGVIEQISPITQEESSQLRNEIQADINKTVAEPFLEDGTTANPHYKATIKAKVLHFARNPWIRLLMAASFVLVVKGIKDWYNGKYDDDKKEE